MMTPDGMFESSAFQMWKGLAAHHIATTARVTALEALDHVQTALERHGTEEVSMEGSYDIIEEALQEAIKAVRQR